MNGARRTCAHALAAQAAFVEVNVSQIVLDGDGAELAFFGTFPAADTFWLPEDAWDTKVSDTDESASAAYETGANTSADKRTARTVIKDTEIILFNFFLLS